MGKVIGCVIYILIGIAGGQTIGYGLVEALLWPLFMPLALWCRIKGKEDK